MLYKEEVDRAMGNLAKIQRRVNKVYQYHKLDRLEVGSQIDLIRTVLKKVLDTGLPAAQNSLFEEDNSMSPAQRRADTLAGGG